jgi:hypothetical protein
MKTVLLSIACCFTFSVLSQTVLINWVDADEDKKEFVRPNFVFTKSNGNLIIISFKDIDEPGKQNVTLTEFTPQLKKVKSSFDSKWQNRSREELIIEQAVKLGGKLYMIGKSFNKSKKNVNYSVVEIGDNLLPKGKAIDLVNIFVDAKRKLPRINFEFSPDSTKVLLSADLFTKKKDLDEYYFKVMDNAWNTLWEKSIEMPYMSKEMEFMDSKVSNSGSIFIQYYRIVKKEAENYILFLSNSGNTQNTITIDKKDKFIGRYKASFGDGDIVHCLGFYSKAKDREFYHGFSNFNLDLASQRVYGERFIEFDSKIMGVFYDKIKKAPKKGGIAYTYDLKDIYSKSDGGYVAFFEETVVDKKNNALINVTAGQVYLATGYNKTESFYEKHGYSSFNNTKITKKDIIIAHFDASGRLTNMSPIYKELKVIFKEAHSMFSASESQSQFLYKFIKTFHFNYNDNVYSIFLDHTKNDNDDRYRNRKKIKTLSNFYNGNGVLSWVGNGKIRRKKILDKSDDYTLCPHFCRQIAPNKVLLYSTGYNLFGVSKKEKLGILTLEENEMDVLAQPSPTPAKVALTPAPVALSPAPVAPVEVKKEEPASPQAKQEISLATENKVTIKNKYLIAPPAPTDDVYKGKNVFTVEVLTASVPINKNNDILEHFPNYKMTYEDGLYHYTTGEFINFNEAMKFVEYIKSNGFDGKVIQYIDGVRQ